MDAVLCKPVQRTALIDLLQRYSAHHVAVEPSCATSQEAVQQGQKGSDQGEDDAVHRDEPRQAECAPASAGSSSALSPPTSPPPSFTERSQSAGEGVVAAAAVDGTVPDAPVVFAYLPLLKLFGSGMESHIRAAIQKFHEQGTAHLFDPIAEQSGDGNLQLLCRSTHTLRGKASYVGGTALKSAGVLHL